MEVRVFNSNACEFATMLSVKTKTIVKKVCLKEDAKPVLLTGSFDAEVCSFCRLTM